MKPYVDHTCVQEDAVQSGPGSNLPGRIVEWAGRRKVGGTDKGKSGICEENAGGGCRGGEGKGRGREGGGGGRYVKDEDGRGEGESEERRVFLSGGIRVGRGSVARTKKE